MPKEFKIGKNTIGEETKLTLSISTALWIIGGVITIFSTIFTWMYFDVKSDVESYKQTTQKGIDAKLDKISEKNEQFLNELGEVKGNVKVILDRTSGMRNINNGEKSNLDITPENNKPK